MRHIEKIINGSSLQDNVKESALKIFNLIAVAEAKVHGISIEAVHFHEVGALDSIADIVGAAICLDYLKVDKIMSSSIQLGGGTVMCAHGLMPVPAPATAEIVAHTPVKTGLVNHEATTPTGAAILVAMVDEFTDSLNLPIKKTGYGIGNRDSEVPNVLRVFLCEDAVSTEDVSSEAAIVLESNIDDMNPEHYDFLLEQLFKAGASDAWLTPIIMKKSRPAVTLSVLCTPELTDKIKEIMFVHSSSLGMRESKILKHMLRREEILVDTIYGPVRVKRSYFKGKLVNQKPESEDCRKLALSHNISIAEVEQELTKTLKE